MTRCPSPITAEVCAPVITATFGRLLSLRVSTASARSCGSNSIRVTWLTRPGEIDGGFDAGIAAADHGHALALEQRVRRSAGNTRRRDCGIRARRAR